MPTSDTEFWVDISYDLLTPVKAQVLKGAGVKGVVQCLWADGREQPPNRVINLRNAEIGGLDIAGYVVVTPWSGITGAGHVQAGCRGIPQDLWNALLFVAIDVEVTGLTDVIVRGAVEALVALGKSRVIYTSWNAWVNYFGNSLAFTDCLLWNAYWDGAPDVDFASLPFGGWKITQVLGEQWSGGTNVGGTYADRNQFVTALLRPQPVPDDPCALIKLRVKGLEETVRAAADADWETVGRWAKFFGGV